MARAPETVAGAPPVERRHYQHRPRISRPDDEEQRVVAHEILRRRVERREARAGKEEQRQRAAKGNGVGHRPTLSFDRDEAPWRRRHVAQSSLSARRRAGVWAPALLSRRGGGGGGGGGVRGGGRGEGGGGGRAAFFSPGGGA